MTLAILLNQTVANEGDEMGWALPLPNIPTAAMIVEGLGTIHQLLLRLEEESTEPVRRWLRGPGGAAVKG